MSVFEQRSRGRSLSVKQLIDERMRKLEDKQIAEIQTEFAQKHTALANSIRVKGLILANDNGPMEECEIRAAKAQNDLQNKLRVLLEVLTQRSVDNNKSAISRNDVQYSLEFSSRTAEEFDQLVDVDRFIEDILAFDERACHQLSTCLDNPNALDLSDDIVRKFNYTMDATMREGICEALKAGPICVGDNTDAVSATIIQQPRAVRPFRARHSGNTPVKHITGESTEMSRAVLKRLQAHHEIEYHIQREIDDQLSIVDSKYLKLVAEASTCIFVTETEQGGSRGPALDGMWVKKILPFLLKKDDEIVKDIIEALSMYTSLNYTSNPRIQKLVQIESSKMTFS
jgi:hypothetical protein